MRLTRSSLLAAAITAAVPAGRAHAGAAAAASPTFGTIHLSGAGSSGDASGLSATDSAGATETLAAWADAIAALQADASGVTSPVFQIGTASPLAAGSAPTVSDTVSGNTHTLSFGIPVGATGATGAPGATGATGAAGATGTSPALAIGTVTTLPAGSAATVSDSVSGAVNTLSFGIPQGSAGSGGGVATPATASSLGTVRPDDLSMMVSSGGVLSAVSLAGGANTLSETAAGQAVAAPATTASDSTANDTLAYVMQWNPTAITSSTNDAAIFGKWGSAGETYLIYYNHGSNDIEWAATWHGNGSPSYGAFGALPTLNAKGFLGFAINASGSAKTFAAFGVTVGAGSAMMLQSATGAAGTWSQVGNTSTGLGTAGFNALGTSGPPFQIGNSNPTGSLAFTLYGAALGDDTMNYTPGVGFTGTIFYEPPIAVADAYPANGPDGQLWTDNGLTLSINGTVNLTPIATAASAGMVMPDGTTTSANAAGMLSATSQIPLVPPGHALARTICARAGDAIDVADFDPNPGGTIGSAYGSTVAAVAATTAKACDGSTYQPFAWLADGINHGGVVWSMADNQGQEVVAAPFSQNAVAVGGSTQQFSALGNVVAGDIVSSGSTEIGIVGSVTDQVVTTAAALSTPVTVGDVVLDTFTRQTATVTAVNGTAYTLGPVSLPFIAGHFLVDTESGAHGTIASVASPIVTYAGSGALSALGGGNAVNISQGSSASSAGSTSSTSLAVASTVTATAGNGVYDVTAGGTVGFIANVTSATGLTLAANARIAVAAGDVLAFFPPTKLGWIENFFAGQGSGFAAHVAKFEDPNYMSFYPEVGDTIADASNATPCLPAGDTIAAIDTNPNDAGYGQMTLATGSTSYCPAGTTFRIALPDSAVAGLASDWFALETALYLAQQAYGTGSERAVNLPDTTLYPTRPVIYYANPNGFRSNLTIRGTGSSMLDFSHDFYQYKCALSPESLNSGSVGSLLRGFYVQGPSQNSASTEGVSPALANGVCLTDGEIADNLQVHGFHSGVGMLDDHQQVLNSTLGNNLFGIEFLPLSQTLGNQVFENDRVIGNYEAGLAIAASNQWDSGTMLDTHCGFSAFCWYKEAPSPVDVASSYQFVTEDTLIDNWFEGTGNGAVVDASGSNGAWDKNTIIEAMGAFVTPYNPGVAEYFPEISGGAYTDAQAEIYVSGWTNNKVIGGDLFDDYLGVMQAAIVSTGTCQNDSFDNANNFLADAQYMMTRPPLLCGSDGGGVTFGGGAWTGVFKMASAAVSAGGAVAMVANDEVAPVSTTTGLGGWIGTAPIGCTAGRMCEVVEHGTGVPLLADANQGSPASGAGYNPDTSGAYALSGNALSVAVSEGPVTAGQTGKADMR